MKGKVIAAALAAGTAALFAGCGSSPSSAKATQVSATTASALTVSSVSPAVIPVATAATLTVYGTGFQSGTTVLVDSTSVPTTYVSGTQLTVTVPSTQFSTGAIVPVTASDHGVLAGAQGTLEVDNPRPVLSQTSPVSALAGSGTVAVTMTGSGFSSKTTAMFSGAARPTAYVSPTEISLTLSAADAATAGSYPLTVVNAAPGGGSSSPSSFLITNPVPAVSSLLPLSLSVGSSGTVVTLQGSGFLAGSTVFVNGAPRTTSVASATQLSFVATTADVSVATTLQVAVQNPAPGGGISAAQSLPVKNPTPSIAAVSPSTIAFGTAAPTTVTLAGTNFAAGATVSVSGTPRAATVVSSTSLTFPVSTAEQAIAGAVPVVVTNPAPGGGTSAPAALTITNAVPTAGALSPSTIAVGTPSATLVTLGGSGFAPGATVSVGGVSRAATLISSAKLSFSVTSAEVATVGSLPVFVTNPAPGGGSSSVVNLAVTGLVPTIGTITPVSVVAGTGSPATIAVAGSNFATSATVSVNGVARAASVLNAGSLTFPLTAAETAAAGTLSVVIINPNPGGGASAPAQLAINNPQPSALSLSPATVLVGTAAPAAVSITGGNFVAGSSVSVAGVARSATIVNSHTAAINLTATDLAAAGTLPVIVTNPGPGGGSSPAATLTIANPLPGALVLSPSNIVVGTPAPVSVTVSGTNFVAGSSILVAGTARNAVYSSSTKLSFALAAADLASAGALPVVVTNPGPGGGSSQASTFTVSNPQPGQITLSPTTVVAGTTSPVTVTVSGSSFVAASSVLVNGQSRPATVLSPTSLSFVLSAADIAAPGALSVAVSTPSPGGGTTAAATIILTNPVPGLNSISPASVTVGTAPALLTLAGSNFEPGAQVFVNGNARALTIVSASQITAQLVAGDQASAGSLVVSVRNPTPGGGSSNAVQLPVVNPVPGLTALSPSTTAAGGTSPLLVTVSGSGFVPATTANVNGSARSTTVVSSTQLTLLLTVADQATAADLAITVSTPAPGGGTSLAIPFHVQNALPVITSLSPNAVTAGASSTLR